jgi:histidyl-tRNA synthetase
MLGSEELQKEIFVVKNMMNRSQSEHPIIEMLQVVRQLG